MSGIAGIICFDGAPIEPGQITKITGAMTHRGPDGIHHWVSGSVALGQCMLRTTPESLKETQPLTNEDESLVLVVDGRLDNREELKHELRGQGITLRAYTDAELVLRAYQLWGEDSPRHLLGDFAFAIWDAHCQKIFCARDHFGVRPFLYFSGKQYLAFASDEEAFFGLPGVPREPNEVQIACILVPELDGYDFDASFIKDIVKLPAGKSLSVQRTGQRTIRTYWQLEPQEETRFASDLECEEAFRSVFKQAIQSRMRTLGNPALMLSGGMDSASIAGAAREILREMPHLELHTFSAVSDEAKGCTETRNIRAIVKGYEQHAHFISFPSFQTIVTDDDLKKAAWTCAHPVSNFILLAAIMYLAASRCGNRVMYDGVDGDLVTYTPLRYMSRLLRSGEWREAGAEAHKASVNNTYLKHLSPLAILSLSAWDSFAPISIKRLKRKIGNMVHAGAIERSLINPDFAKKIRLAERLKDRQANFESGRLLSDQQLHIRALTPVGIPGAMEGFNRIATRYGVEPRHPWSDKRLVEFCLRLPLRQKVRDGWGKYLVRKAMADALDEDVRWHTGKDHLGWWFRHRLMSQSKEEIRSTLQTAEGAIGTYLDTGILRSVLRRYDTNAQAQDREQLYTAMTLALWLDRIKAAT